MNVPEWLIGALPPGAVLIVAGIWIGLKMRNGKAEDASDTRGPVAPVATPECPGKSYFEEGKAQEIRQEEAFRAMVHSWDRVVDGLEKHTGAVRESAEKQTQVILKLAEMVTKRRNGNG